MSFSIIYITFPDEVTARDLSTRLVRERYAACANIFPIQSAYWWQGVIEDASEWVALLKTTHRKWLLLQQAVEKWHPYAVPCIMRWEVEANDAYEAWIAQEVQ